VLRLAARLTSETGDRLPINLGPLRERRGIRGVKFRPLLTDGTLVVLNDGFYILVRCTAGSEESLNTLFGHDETGAELPQEIVRQSRFTIAHEIAHTFLYDIRHLPPRPKAFVNRLYQPEDIERICNKAAAALLLPEEAIERDFAEADLLDPEILKRITDVALVSRPVLVWRLRELNRVGHPFGIVAVIRRKQRNWYFAAVSGHYSIPRELTSKMLAQSVPSILGPSASFLLLGGASEMTFRWNSSAHRSALTFLCKTEPLGDGQSSAFLTLRREQ
jgi:hypothetical protein